MESEQNHVPEGWISVRIDEIVEVNPGKPPKDLLPADAPVSFVPMPAVDAEKGAITEPEVREYHKVRSGYTAFRNDDLIVAKITPCMENGKAAVARDLVNGLGFGSSEFHVLRSRGTVLPEYLYHFVRQQSYRDSAEKQMTGSVGQKRVPADYIKSSVIPLPPLPEQRRIVARLEALLADLERVRGRLDAVAATMQRFRNAVLDTAVIGQLTKFWRYQNLQLEFIGNPIDIPENTARHQQINLQDCPKGGSTPRDFEAIDFPVEWCFPSLEKVANIVDPQPSHRTPPVVMDGIPYIGMSDIDDTGNINFQNARKISRDVFLEHQARYSLQTGDFIIGKIGTIGNPIHLPRPFNYTLSANILLIQPNTEITAPNFLYYLIKSRIIEQILIKESNATTQSAYGIKKLRALQIPLPPLPEQHEIVRRVDALFALADRIEGEVSGALERVEALREAVLAKAFRGELVPTEAEVARREGRAYEPAGVLLERVRARREGEQKKASERGRRPAGQMALPVE